MNDILEILRDEKYLGQEGMRNLAAEEISLLRADKDKLVEALAQALANCSLGTPALPSEEEIARVIVRTCEDVGENEDEFCSDRMAMASARAVLALIGDCT